MGEVVELEAPAKAGRPSKVAFQTPLFGRVDEGVFRRSTDGMAVFVLRIGDTEATLPLKGIAMEYKLAPDDPDAVEIRLGYLLAESVWGQGHASELIAGFVAWCRGQPRLRSIVGGVAPDNIASARVLTKNGFVLTDDASPGGDQMYELVLRP